MAVESLESLRPERAASGLRVSAYDRTTSLLIALLLIIGMATLAIVVVFFSSRLQRQPPAIPVTPVSADSGKQGEGDLTDVVPGVENAPEVLEQDLESLLDQVSLAATSDAVLMAEDASSDSAAMSAGTEGDPRGAGTTGDGTGNGREPRREILFEPATFEEYAEWFDRAGLEIAVLGADNLVYYATELSTATPVVRTGDPGKEGRLYFNSTGGPLHPLDRRLAQKAGILDHGALVLQFCKPETQNLLLDLERRAAGGRPKGDIARTVFRVVKQGDAYTFEVAEQQYYR